MLGFVESDATSKGRYGLMSEKAKPRDEATRVVGLLLCLGVVGAVGIHLSASAAPPTLPRVTLVATPTPAAKRSAARPSSVLATFPSANPDADAPDPCPTKPFAQCGGLNFTDPDASTTFNFSGTATSFACCPAGQSCVSFGPVWAMCMPSWGAPAAAATMALAAQPDAQPAAQPAAEPDAKPEAEPAAEPAAEAAAEPKPAAQKAKAKPAPAPAAPAPAPAADPCPTKPFGQCAGLNFTDPAAATTYNFSGAAGKLSCCPAGTSCVAFGPVWGMCMPSWGAPAAAAVALAAEPDAADPAAEPNAEAAAEPKPSAPKVHVKVKVTPDPAADPCPTKPFGQCAGLNFTDPAAGTGYNFSAPAASLYCCPAGTSCVSFGPAWGMCMPSWGAPAAAATTTGTRRRLLRRRHRRH